MTFVLGLTNERIPGRYLPKTYTKPAQTAVALGARDLNRFNCAGCHVLEMPKYTIPEGVKVAEAFTDFKANLRSSYTARGTDYLSELYPDAHVRSAEEARSQTRSKRSSGSPMTKGRPSPSRACRSAFSRTS